LSHSVLEKVKLLPDVANLLEEGKTSSDLKTSMTEPDVQSSNPAAKGSASGAQSATSPTALAAAVAMAGVYVAFISFEFAG